MTVDSRTYEQVALDDPDGKWELHDGRLRRKPDEMTLEHNDVLGRLVVSLARQLDDAVYAVRANSTRTRRVTVSYYIPDVAVVPRALIEQARTHRPGTLDAFSEPLPLVVEVWSPSTGEYDVDEKLPEYQRRGDLEIWRIHPYERILTAWVRQPDGSYGERMARSGMVEPAALPNVRADLEQLFA